MKKRGAEASHFCFKRRMTIHVVRQDKTILMDDRMMDTLSVVIWGPPSRNKCDIITVRMLGRSKGAAYTLTLWSGYDLRLRPRRFLRLGRFFFCPNSFTNSRAVRTVCKPVKRI